MPTVPFIPVPNTLMVEFRFNFNGVMAENVMYFQKVDLTTIETADAEQLLSSLVANWEDNGAPLTIPDCVLNEVYATDLTTQTSPTYAYASGNAGTASGVTLPGNVTATTTFRTAGRGKSSRGRNYWVGIPSGAVDGDTLNGTWQSNVIAYYLAIKELCLVLDPQWQHVIVSKRFEGEWREVGYTQKVTSYAHADDVVDSQRRRLTGRGR